MVKALVGMGVLVRMGVIGEYITNRDLEDMHVGWSPYRLFELNNEQKAAVEEDGGHPPDYSEWREPDGGETGGYVVSIPPGQYYFIPVDR